MTDDSTATQGLLVRAAGGDAESQGELMTRHAPRLRRMIAFRLDPRLRGRLDVDDVMQEVFLAASKSLEGYLARRGSPFFLWLRGVASNKLLELHRYHLGTPIRDARREISLHLGPSPEATSAALAFHLLGRLTRPSEAAIRAEAKARLREALDAMDAVDHEILALRHFEHLTNAEAARVLEIQEAAAGKRYLRALDRLRKALSRIPGGSEL